MIIAKRLKLECHFPSMFRWDRVSFHRPSEDGDLSGWTEKWWLSWGWFYVTWMVCRTDIKWYIDWVEERKSCAAECESLRDWLQRAREEALVNLRNQADIDKRKAGK